MRKFTYSMLNYPIYTSRAFQNMVLNMSKGFLWIKFGYVSLGRIWWERPRIKLHSIVFLQSYSGILGVVKVMSDIYAIVLAILLLLNRYFIPISVADNSHESYMTVLSYSLYLRFQSIRKVNLWNRMWWWMTRMRVMDTRREWRSWSFLLSRIIKWEWCLLPWALSPYGIEIETFSWWSQWLYVFPMTMVVHRSPTYNPNMDNDSDDFWTIIWLSYCWNHGVIKIALENVLLAPFPTHHRMLACGPFDMEFIIFATSNNKLRI